MESCPSANAFVAIFKTEANGTPSRFARFIACALIFGSILNTIWVVTDIAYI